ncbi:hypothetical protein HSB1_10980 [Halogranum salarium B-1]|uniref:Uncharacterized protein n=1 Tax=Halogranum salarium B-1 TaxID=1210908 RepID=J2ZIF5_9EURY|nr:hypothetical protein HSB1_10980 [Halogranum salarium B-1]
MQSSRVEDVARDDTHYPLRSRLREDVETAVRRARERWAASRRFSYRLPPSAASRVHETSATASSATT